MAWFKTNTDELPQHSTTIIGAGTTIVGNIHSNGDIRIDGTLKGNVDADAKIIIGKDGIVQGNVDGKNADILGKVAGKINIAELLYIHGKASVEGDIYATKLNIEPTASFNGNCHMGANVVEFITDNKVAVG